MRNASVYLATVAADRRQPGPRPVVPALAAAPAVTVAAAAASGLERLRRAAASPSALPVTLDWREAAALLARLEALGGA